MGTELFTQRGYSSEPSWASPNIGADGLPVLEPEEHVLLEMRADEVNGVAGSKAVWSLNEAAGLGPGTTVGPINIAITTHRLVYSKRAGTDDWTAGHLRWDWLRRIHPDAYQVEDSIVFGSADLDAATHITLKDQPYAGRSAELAEWCWDVAAAYHRALYERIGVSDPALIDAIDHGRERLTLRSAKPDSHLLYERGLLSMSGPPQGFGGSYIRPGPMAPPQGLVRCGLSASERCSTRETRHRGPSFAFVSLTRPGQADQTGLYPVLTDRLTPEIEAPDGQLAHRLNIINVSTTAGVSAAEALGQEGWMLVTQSRIVFGLTSFIEGNDWDGRGWGVLLAIGAEAVSNRRARQQQGENVIAGQLRYDWIKSVTFTDRNNIGVLTLSADELATNPYTARSVHVTLGFKQQSGYATELAMWVAHLVAHHRILHGTADSATRNELDEIAQQRWTPQQLEERTLPVPGATPASPRMEKAPQDWWSPTFGGRV